MDLSSSFSDNTEYRYHPQTGEGKGRKKSLINRALPKQIAFSRGMQMRKRTQYSRTEIIQMFK